MKQISSAITGSLNPERRDARPTGLRLGETGSGEALNAVELLARGATPPENWTTYATCSIRRKSLTLQNENPFEITATDRNDARSALAELQNWLRPASMEALVIELSERYLASGRAAETGDDRKALIALYARKLREYPADVALDAVSGWRGAFFPAFEELRDAILADRRMLVRRQKMAALRAFLADDHKPEGFRPPTDAQIARNADWVRQSRNEAPARLSAEKLARLAEVDRVHGDAAKARVSRATVLG